MRWEAVWVYGGLAVARMYAVKDGSACPYMHLPPSMGERNGNRSDAAYGVHQIERLNKAGRQYA